MEEREAIELLRRGDISGLEALVWRYHDRAVGAAYLISRDRGLAEDVAQAAFVKAYEKIHRFDTERPFGPWFMKIVVNDAVKAASRQRRAVAPETGGLDDSLARVPDPGAGPEKEAEQAEARRVVWRAMEHLPPAQRAAVVQRYYLGMSEAEMAESAGSPRGTIKKRLHSARARLAKLLGPRASARASLKGKAAGESPERGTPSRPELPTELPAELRARLANEGGAAGRG